MSGGRSSTDLAGTILGHDAFPQFKPPDPFPMAKIQPPGRLTHIREILGCLVVVLIRQWFARVMISRTFRLTLPLDDWSSTKRLAGSADMVHHQIEYVDNLATRFSV